MATQSFDLRSYLDAQPLDVSVKATLRGNVREIRAAAVRVKRQKHGLQPVVGMQ